MGFQHSAGESRVDTMRKQVSLGQMLGANLITVGEVLLVAESGAARADEISQVFGPSHVFNDLQKAADVMVSGAGDYMLVMPKDDSAVWALVADLDSTVFFAHFVGLTRAYQRPRISFTGAFDFDLSGNGVEVGFLDIVGNTADQEVLNSAGAGCWFHDCMFSAADGTAGADVYSGGSQDTFDRCQFGDDYDHAVNANYIDIAGSIRTFFNDCLFLNDAAATTDFFCENHTAQTSIFRRCTFINQGSAAMDSAMNSTGSSPAFAHYCTVLGAAEWEDTASRSFVSPVGMGKTIAAGEVFNPGLALDGAGLTIGADT